MAQTNETPLTPEVTGPYTEGNDPAHIADLKQILLDLTNEVKERLRNPRHIKKLSILEILTHIENIAKVLKAPGGTVIAKNIQLNFDKAQGYAKSINESPARRNELRDAAAKQLKRFPS